MTETLETTPVAADSVYSRLGGAPAIHALVDRFYELSGPQETHPIAVIRPNQVGDAMADRTRYPYTTG